MPRRVSARSVAPSLFRSGTGLMRDSAACSGVPSPAQVATSSASSRVSGVVLRTSNPMA